MKTIELFFDLSRLTYVTRDGKAHVAFCEAREALTFAKVLSTSADVEGVILWCEDRLSGDYWYAFGLRGRNGTP